MFKLVRPGWQDLYLQDGVKVAVDRVTHRFALAVRGDDGQWHGTTLSAIGLHRLGEALIEEASCPHDFSEGTEELMGAVAPPRTEPA